jgi:hypothetical protein
MTQYDKLDILGNTSTTREEIFRDDVASAFLPARNVARCPSNHIWFVSKLSMV